MYNSKQNQHITEQITTDTLLKYVKIQYDITIVPREQISKVGLTMYIKVKPHSVVDPAQNTKGILYCLDGDHLIITNNITSTANGKMSCLSNLLLPALYNQALL